MRLAAGCFGRLNMTGGGGTPTPETKIYSGRTYKRYMQLRRRNTSRNGGDRTERRAYVTHKPILQRLQQVAIVCLLVFAFLFPTRQKLRFHLITQTQVRLFLTYGSPCVCSTSDCAMLLRSRRTKRGGITRGRYLSMRVLSVVPRYAVAVGSLSRGNGNRENT